MSDWNEGYVTDTDYTAGYYKELNPNELTIPFLMAGMATPTFENACELGFGQGVSVNINAAVSKTNWYANDFNPNHVSFANDIAQASDASVMLSDDAFVSFCKRDDLPEFDFIGLHGIWTWISDSNREVIVDFIARKLKVGGVLYVSYNTLPGWAPHAPIRHVMTQHEKSAGASGQPIAQRINASLEFTKTLFSHTHALNEQAPHLQDRVEKLFNNDRNYLAHEYFNKDWQPMYFSDMAEWLSPAKVSYVCSSDFNADYNILNMSNEQLEFLNNTHDKVLKQTLVDFLLNRQFRKDYWVKGERRLSASEIHNAWRELRFILVTKPDDIKLTAGRAQLKSEVYTPIIELLSDHQIHTFDEIEHELKENHNMNSATVFESLAIFQGKQDVLLVLPTPEDDIIQQCQQLNQRFMQLNQDNIQLPYLISPLTRSVVHVDHVTHLLISATQQHGDDVEKCAEFAWGILKKNNRLLIVDGETLTTDEDNLAEMKKRAEKFAEHTRGIYKTLQVITEADK